MAFCDRYSAKFFDCPVFAPKSCRISESGSVLITSLVLLVLITSLAVFAAQKNLITVQLSRNLKAQMLVRQSALNALTVAASSLAGLDAFRLPLSREACFVRSGRKFTVAAKIGDPTRELLAHQDDSKKPSGCSFGAFTEPLVIDLSSRKIRAGYLLEYLTDVNHQIDGREGRRLFFRISAFAEAASIQLAVQGIYSRNFDADGRSISELEKLSERELL